MPTSRLKRSGRAIVTASLLTTHLLLLSWPLIAHASEQSNRNQSQTFDIPAQPLEVALQHYSKATGLNVLVDSNLISQQQSKEVRGSFTPTQALDQLITHTGLAVHYVSTQTFTLKPQIVPSRKNIESLSLASLYTSEFVAALQYNLERLICKDSLLSRGNYRMLIQVSLNQHSHIENIRLVQPTDNPKRDAQVLDTIKGLSFPVSAGKMPQPITLLLLPNNIRNTCTN